MWGVSRQGTLVRGAALAIVLAATALARVLLWQNHLALAVAVMAAGAVGIVAVGVLIVRRVPHPPKAG